MFEAICIRRQHLFGNPIDLGFLAEAMLFYREVHVVADHTMLSYLVRVCGPDSLIAAVEHGFLKLSYLENQLAISTLDEGRPTERYGLHFVSSPKHKLLPITERYFCDSIGRVGRSRRLANKLARHVSVVLWGQLDAKAAINDLLDAEITDRAANIVLQELAPGFRPPQDVLFRVTEATDTLLVDTNLDFGEAEHYYKLAAPDSSFQTATVLVAIFDALADVRFSARFSSELAVSSKTSAIAEIKFGRLLWQRQYNDERVKLFQEWTFDEGRAIRDAVNKGRQSFDDILKIVAAAQKFKEWLATQSDTSDVRREYLREITKIDWVDKLPAKSFRWLLFSALSGALGFHTGAVAGIFTGAALNALDVFLIDKLAKGWKPNQFVEGPLREFVHPTDSETRWL